jgi:peptide/nickel transport system substrate-binding protein
LRHRKRRRRFLPPDTAFNAKIWEESMSSRTIRRSGRFLAALLAPAVALAVSAAPAMAQKKDELVFASPILRQHFDPTLMVATTDYLINDVVFDGLLNLTVNGKKPALATSWTVSADGKQIDFELRKNVVFHNGDPFTAEDVKFTFEKILRPDNNHSYRNGFTTALERVEILDTHKVRLVLKNPWPAFFTTARFGLQSIVPKNYYEKVGAKGFQEKPVGTGPFKLVEAKAGEWNRFEAHDKYWGEVAHFKTLVQRLVAEPFTRYAMLEKGEADIVSGLTGALLEKISTNKNIQLFSSKYASTAGIYFNPDKFPEAKDKRVRLAIGHAINLPQITKKILNGTCEPASTILTPATFGYEPNKYKVIPYDPAKAKALLKEAGVAPGKEVDFVLSTESLAPVPNAPQVLEAIAGDLEAVGFKVKRLPHDTQAWFGMMRGGKQPAIYWGGASMSDDAGELLGGWYVSNAVWTAGQVRVPEYDKLYKEQLETADGKAREKMLAQFAALEDQNKMALPLFWCDASFAATARIKTWKPATGTPYHLNFNNIQFK